jgi:hypothetical protein
MASFLVFSVFLAQLVHHINGVQSGILGDGTGDHFQSSGEGVDNQLLLARDGAGVVTQVAGEFHFYGSTTSHNRWEFHGTTHHHNRVVQGTFSLLDELFGTSSQNNCGSFGFGTALEEVIAFGTELDFVETATSTQRWLLETVDGGLDDSTCGLGDTHQILVRNAASAENVAVGEVLGGEIANGQFGKDNLGSTFIDIFEFVVNNIPFGINNVLVFFGTVDTDFSVLLLALEFELEIKDADLRVVKAFGLLFESRIGKSFFEGHAVHHEGFGDGATADAFHTHKFLVQKVRVQLLDTLYDELAKLFTVRVEQLGIKGGLCALDQHVAAGDSIFFVDLDLEVFQFL